MEDKLYKVGEKVPQAGKYQCIVWMHRMRFYYWIFTKAHWERGSFSSLPSLFCGYCWWT